MSEKLSKNAADGPHVYRLTIVGRVAEELGRAVPPRHNVLCERVLALDVETAREAEVAHRQVTIRIHKQITGLEVAVQHVRGVDVLERAQNLIEEVLEMLVCQHLLGSDDALQV